MAREIFDHVKGLVHVHVVKDSLPPSLTWRLVDGNEPRTLEDLKVLVCQDRAYIEMLNYRSAGYGPVLGEEVQNRKSERMGRGMYLSAESAPLASLTCGARHKSSITAVDNDTRH